MASVEDVARLVGIDPDELEFLGEVTPQQRKALVDAIADAGRARDAELRRAVDDALGFVPRPLRGRVVKMLSGRRG